MSWFRLSCFVLMAWCVNSASATSVTPSYTVSSPDGRILVAFSLADARATYSVSVGGKEILRPSRLGVVRDDADFTANIDVTANYEKRAAKLEKVEDRYELLTSKRRQNVYRANRRVLEVQTAAGARMDIEFQVSNDGFAFRYVFPETDAKIHRISREASSFNFLPGTRGWLQPIAPARSGWNESNPSYEEYYERDIPAGQPSLQGGAWVFPALFRSSAGGATRGCWSARPACDATTAARGCWRRAAAREYFIDFPGPLETSNGGAVTPESTLPWTTPWRFVVIGDLKTIAESTLGTDLADPPAKGFKTTAPGPGKASWSWPLLGDDKTVVKVQKRFVDYAAEMGWQYTLVDSAWDRQIGYDGLKELVEYGAAEEREDPHLVQLGRRVEHHAADAARSHVRPRDAARRDAEDQGPRHRRREGGFLRGRCAVDDRVLPRHSRGRRAHRARRSTFTAPRCRAAGSARIRIS